VGFKVRYYSPHWVNLRLAIDPPLEQAHKIKVANGSGYVLTIDVQAVIATMSAGFRFTKM